jgi:hypothetical protein
MNLVCATSSLVYLSGIFYVHVSIMGWMVMLWPWAFMMLGVCDLCIVGAVAFSSVQFRVGH